LYSCHKHYYEVCFTVDKTIAKVVDILKFNKYSNYDGGYTDEPSVCETCSFAAIFFRLWQR
ncbi:MAG: hypothetical protein M3O67_05165, partial [Bacteroidota bacterium]|nr:hypothetical protein [Bacteroidota bacterium]